MCKKAVILGLVLLLAGGALLGWVFTEQKKEKQLLEEQRERFKTNLSRLAQIIGDGIDAGHFEDIVYDENSQQESDKYKKREETRELILTVSALFTLTGGAILGWWLLLWTARLLIRGISGLTKFFADVFRLRKRSKAEPLTQADAKAKAKIKAKAEAEARAKAEAEEKARAEAEAEKRAKAKAKRKAKAAKKARAKAKAKRRAKAKSEKRAKAEAEKRAKAEEKARAKAEAEERIRAEAEAGIKAKAEEEGRAEANAKEDEKLSEEEQKRCEQQSPAKKYSKVLRNSGWQSFNKDYVSRHEPVPSQTTVSTKSKQSAENPAVKYEEECLGSQKLAVLLSDEESVELEEPVKVETGGPSLEESLKTQAENLEKQVEEFRQMAGPPFCNLLQNGEPPQSVQQAALEHSKPVSDSLRELTQQVSAIREYAAGQQERVKKLQDGYDWNIIRKFCLRVIRCIDNLENRINKLSEQDIDTTGLEEIRDELVFALESTGVEQFEPKINSNYRGQEKNTEAVKDKEDCDDPTMTGKIAKVLRRGYQYFIDEENVKVVRPAQVKLFG